MSNLRHDPSRRGPVATATVTKALSVVDKSGLVPLLEMWEEQDRKYRGGRRPYLSFRATLALWLMVAMEHEPMHIRRVERLLRERMTPKTCALLEIAYDPFALPNAFYERTRIATNRITNLIDAFPLKNRNRRMTKEEYAAELENRKQMRDVLEQRTRRATIFRNQWMEATYQLVPAPYRPERVSIVVDATRIPTYARGIGLARLVALEPTARISVEPDFGFYQRNYQGKSARDNAVVEGKPERRNDNTKISEYAAEHELAVMCSNDPHTPDAVPNLILALENHVPGVDPIGAARSMVDSLYERGHTIEHFTGDRAYLPGGEPDRLVNPLRERGVKIVMDYPKSRLGLREQKAGAILIDGNWYCASMPEHLQQASTVYRGIIDPLFNKRDDRSVHTRKDAKEKWQAAVRAREQYLFRPKENMDERGRIPLMCPAAGLVPTVTCDRKPNSRADGRELLPIAVIKPPGKVCENKISTSFHVNDSGAYGQHYQYGSQQWQDVYGHLRSQVESTNAYAKDDSTFALARASRRRMRGYTAQSFLITLSLVAVNLRILRDFLLERDERAEEKLSGQVSPKRRTYRSRRNSPETRIAVSERDRKRKPADGTDDKKRRSRRRSARASEVNRT